MSSMDLPTVILDPGSCTTKAGFPGELPSEEIPSMIARNRHVEGRPDYGRKDRAYIGHDAVCKRGVCQIRYPIEHGFVSDWDEYETLLQHTLIDKLGIIPEQHPVLITENPRNPKGNTEKMVELAFENIGVPYLCVQNTSVMSLHSEGLDSGLVVELGDGDFIISPIIGNSLLRLLSPRIPWGGRFISDLLRRQMLKDDSATTADQKGTVKSTCFWNALNDIKHKCCFVSQDYESDLRKAHDNDYVFEMPDGTDLKLTSERFIAPEAIFKPELLGIEMNSLPRQISDALKKADDDVRSKLLSNVVVCGGSSLFPGLAERFQSELERFTQQKVHVVASLKRQYSAWIGASRFATTFPIDSKYWMSKDEYDEDGPTKIFRKILN